MLYAGNGYLTESRRFEAVTRLGRFGYKPSGKRLPHETRAFSARKSLSVSAFVTVKDAIIAL
jgi:hypothetical protein